tara:strand:- start:427 stop:867 length:441 start_codon:yes stop_codon:yes gene_type:complete
MPIKTFKGQLPIGLEQKIHLSTNDGLTGYRVKKFQVISSTPATGNVEFVAKLMLNPDSNISAEVDFNDTDLIAVNYSRDGTTNERPFTQHIIFDHEAFNQDIYINITDAGGATTPANYYIELEQFKIDLNTSTYHTLKNIRSKTQL